MSVELRRQNLDMLGTPHTLPPIVGYTIQYLTIRLTFFEKLKIGARQKKDMGEAFKTVFECLSSPYLLIFNLP